ncbi:MAG: rhomboid family intramembrane serine protease, partial [Phycisphaerales bacterium]|nr:rhomboid family intramembrane serine protease [Phycisphaerales bacterium]
LIGASGSIYGILLAAALVAPDMKVMLLFPPIPMKLRTMASVFLGIATLQVLVGSANAGGEAAHLGGALLGFLLIKQPWLLGWAESSARQRSLREQYASSSASTGGESGGGSGLGSGCVVAAFAVAGWRQFTRTTGWPKWLAQVLRGPAAAKSGTGGTGAA